MQSLRRSRIILDLYVTDVFLQHQGLQEGMFLETIQVRLSPKKRAEMLRGQFTGEWTDLSRPISAYGTEYRDGKKGRNTYLWHSRWTLFWRSISSTESQQPTRGIEG